MMIFETNSADALITAGKMMFVVMTLAFLMWSFYPGGDDNE
jgi:hypothetical protein